MSTTTLGTATTGASAPAATGAPVSGNRPLPLAPPRYTADEIESLATGLDAISRNTTKAPSPDAVYSFTTIWDRASDGSLKKSGSDFGPNSEEVKKTLADGCASTGFKGSDGECRNVISNCIFEDDPTSLAQCFIDAGQHGDKWRVVESEINRMHPILAFKILQKFGFRQIRDDGVKKVERRNSWVSHLMGRLPVEEVQLIKNNTNLLAYLDMLAAYVNANPAILNPGAPVPSARLSDNESKGITKYAEKLRLNFYDFKDDSSSAHINKLRSILDIQRVHKFSPWDEFRTTALGTRSMTPGVPFTNSPFGGMMGGGQVANLVQRHMDDSLAGANLIERVFQSAKADLSRHGKTLDPVSERRLNEHIAQLKKTEADMLETLAYIDTYVANIDAGNEPSGNEQISEADIKARVERLNRLDTRYKSGQQVLLEVLKALEKNIEGETISLNN